MLGVHQCSDYSAASLLSCPQWPATDHCIRPVLIPKNTESHRAYPRRKTKLLWESALRKSTTSSTPQSRPGAQSHTQSSCRWWPRISEATKGDIHLSAISPDSKSAILSVSSDNLGQRLQKGPLQGGWWKFRTGAGAWSGRSRCPCKQALGPEKRTPGIMPLPLQAGLWVLMQKRGRRRPAMAAEDTCKSGLYKPELLLLLVCYHCMKAWSYHTHSLLLVISF